MAVASRDEAQASQAPPHSGTHLPGGPLYAILHPHALAVVARARGLTRMIGGTYSECETYPDFVHSADIAVLFAYVELGGDVHRPETFPWTEREQALRDRARVLFRHSLQLGGSVYADMRQRTTPRRNADRTVCDLWQRWLPIVTTGRGDHATQREGEEATEPERSLRAEQLATLLPALAQVLSADEFDLLVDLYCLERSVQEIARGWMATRPAYAGVDGFGRAQQAIWKCKSRALKRARERLPQVWATLAQEGAL